MYELSLPYIFSVILKRLWIIILATVICLAGALAYCFFIAVPVYKSYGSIIVTNGAVIDANEEDKIVNGSDITASLNLIDTCVDLLKTPAIYKNLSDNIYGKYSYKTLQNNIEIKARKSTSLFIDISYKSSDEDDVATVLQEFLALCPDYISNTIPSTMVKIEENAEKKVQVAPRSAYISAFSALVGALITIVVAVIIDLSDQAIKNQEDFSKDFNVPVLGVVPDFESTSASQGGYSYGKY